MKRETIYPENLILCSESKDSSIFFLLSDCNVKSLSWQQLGPAGTEELELVSYLNKRTCLINSSVDEEFSTILFNISLSKCNKNVVS